MDLLTPMSIDPETENKTQLYVREYFRQNGIDWMQAAEMGVMIGSKDGNIAIAYVNIVEGRPVNIKLRTIARTGQTEKKDALGYDKDFMQVSPNKGYNPPYGIRPMDEDTLIICEGEKDVLALRTAGYQNAVSLPDGADTKVKECFAPYRKEWLAGVKRFIICGDHDHPGRICTERLVNCFGTDSWLCEWPDEWQCKDISDVLRLRGADDVRSVIAGARHIVSNLTVSPSARREQIKAISRGEYDHGYDVGHGPITDGLFHPTDEGGMIIVTGKPNAGKTDFLNDMMARLMFKRDKYCAFLSFEVPNKDKHMVKMMQLILGKLAIHKYTEELLDATIDRLDSRMLHIDLGVVEPSAENIIHEADRIREQHPLSYLVIDPFLFLVLEKDRQTTETQAITQTLTYIQAWARHNRIWVIIVAHPRKLHKKNDGTNEHEDIDFYSINGSAAWANLADFLFSLERVWPKLEKSKSVFKSYTRMEMLKVRDQEFCTVGEAFYLRQPCGRYDERATKDQCIMEMEYQNIAAHEREPW